MVCYRCWEVTKWDCWCFHREDFFVEIILEQHQIQVKYLWLLSSLWWFKCIYGKCFKILNTFLGLFSKKEKIWLHMKAGIHKMLVRIANKEDPDQTSALFVSVANPEGVGEGHSNPPLKQNYFIFMENFQKNQVKLTNWIVLCKFEPPIMKSWICPCV